MAVAVLTVLHVGLQPVVVWQTPRSSRLGNSRINNAIMMFIFLATEPIRTVVGTAHVQIAVHRADIICIIVYKTSTIGESDDHNEATAMKKHAVAKFGILLRGCNSKCKACLWFAYAAVWRPHQNR